MPDTNLSLEKFNRVREGVATSNDKKSFTFAKILLRKLTQLPQCKVPPVSSSDNLCDKKIGNPQVKQNFIFEERLIEKNGLKNIFDFIAAVIDSSKENMTSEIKNLLKLCNIFLKIDLSKFELSPEQANLLNASYIGLFTRIVNFTELFEIHNEEETNYQIVDLLNLTNDFLETWAKFNINTNYSIFESLQNYTESIGNLTRIAVHEGRDILLIETQMKSLINLLTPYLNADHKKILMYNFAHEYNSGNELTTCKEVFNTTDCDPYRVTEEFFKISAGTKSFDSKISLAKNLDIGLRLLKKLKFDTASFETMDANTKNINNFSQYFKLLIKKTNDKEQTLPDDFTQYLCEFLLYQFKVFKGSDTLIMAYRSSFSLFLALLKNPSAKNNTLINHPLGKAFNPMQILLNNVLNNSSKNKTFEILSTLVIFADVIHLAVNDAETITVEEKKVINGQIVELVKICFKIEEFRSSSALDQFFETFGSMVRKLSKKNQTSKETDGAQKIVNTTKSLLQNAKDNSIPVSRIENFAYAYLEGRYDKKVNTIDIDKHCKKLFNLTDCQKFIPVNQTVAPDSDFIIYKTTPALPLVNTTIVSSINQTSFSISFSNTTTEFPVSLSNTTSNQTAAVDTANTNNDTLTNPALTLGASAAHGVGSGMLNGIIQYFATKYSRHGEQSSKAKAVAIYSSLLVHAAFATTFPFMLFKIQEHINQGNEDEAQQLWDNLLLQALPTFISSASFSLGFHTLFEFTQLCSDRLHTVAQSTVPFFGTAYNLYHSPLETSVQLSASLVTSALTYFGLNRLFPVKNQRHFDIETINTKVKYDAITKECAVELQPLNEEKTSENEASKKTYQFICLPELDKVKNSSKNNLDQLEKLIKTLEENIQTYELQKKKTNTSGISDALEKSIKDNTYILNILKRQFKSANVLCNELTDDMHLKACEMYTLKRKKDFVSAMEKLGNVFKLMETDFKTLQGEIKAAIGYAEAASANFSDEVKKQLNEFSQSIIFPLSQVTLYKDRYSNADAVEKTEKRCKAEANQGVFNALIQADHSIIKRAPTHKEFFNANRNTFAFSRGSGSDSDLRTSTASSSGESELSMTSGNSAHNPIVPQQTAPLLRSFRT